ncbi:MAG: class I SAM-dependent methyltransferase [Dehalococcoidia bacterium]|nr:class I SAM-dependent methyltransferase [Dehalococcoidia bacterium]
MGNSLSDELSKLYAGLGIYVRFYVWARAKLVNLDYYAQVLPHNGLLIDVGCGRGVVANYLSLRFPDSHVIGVDSDHKRVDAALKTVGKRKNISFLLQDARRWALPGCTGVVMTDFLHHVSRRDQEIILRRVFRSLEKEGVLLVSEVDPTARPLYRYWTSWLSDRILYPFSKSRFRKPCEWQEYLSHLEFNVKAIKLRSPIFAGIVYVCQK